MYWTYLRRELSGRKKQTVIVSIGLAIAVALVIVMSSLASGVRAAQATSLESVYGVGTDLTVTGEQSGPPSEGGQKFDFGSGDAEQGSDGSTDLNQSRLEADGMRDQLDASTVSTVSKVSGVSEATGALSLRSMTFSGTIPGDSSTPSASANDNSTAGTDSSDSTAQNGGQGNMPPGGFGGGQFGIDSFTVLGIEPGTTDIGPMSSVSVSSGRVLKASDAGKDVAVIDSAYASSASLSVGDTLSIADTDFTVVGIVASSDSSADTAANVYIPLDVAQDLSGLGDVVSTVYVKADSASSISTVQSAIEKAVPSATVSSQADLASSVSGALSEASSMITGLGKWLAILGLVVAVGLTILFTVSGITRRTRELGTLKSIGWSNRRLVGQIAGESMVRSLIGGVCGIVLGLAIILIINLVSPTIGGGMAAAGGAAVAGGGMPTAGAGGGMPGGAGGPGGSAVASAASVVLNAPVSLSLIGIALGLAVLSGLLAGVVGGWRVSHLSPASSLRSVN